MNNFISAGVAFGRLALLLAGAIGVCCADSLVNTYAAVSAAGYSAAYGYNYSLNPVAPTGAQGSSSSAGCSGNCTYSAGGTTDATGKATSANDSVSLSYYIPQDSLGRGPFSANGSAYAAGSLAAGTMKVSGGGTYEDNGNSGQSGAVGSAAAVLNDVLHFKVAGASGGTTTLIGVTYTLDGNFTVQTPAGDSNGNLLTSVNFGTANMQDRMGSGGSIGYTPIVTGSSASGWVTDAFVVNSVGNVIFNGEYQITGGSADIGVQTYLGVSCGLGTSCDYSHTGEIYLILPANVSYTSDSGVFLTQAGTPAVAPEPGSIGLLLSGAGLIFFGRKRASRFLRLSRESN